MAPRICMILQEDYLTDGRVRRYAEALADHAAQVDILCVRSTHETDASYRRDIRIYRIPMKHGSKSRVGYFAEYCIALLLYFIWVSGLYLRNSYHVIHVHNMPDFLVFSALVPRLLGAKLILDVHDPMPEFYASKFDDDKDGLTTKLLRFQERLSARFATDVIAANNNFKQNLVARGVPAEKITVVQNIADTSIFDRDRYPKRAPLRDESVPGRRFTLLYPGTIAARYGIHIAIRAAAELREQIPDLLIRIVGRHNAYVDELVQLAEELNVAEQIEFLREVSLHDIPRLMAEADVGIYPARADPHMSIATPTKVLEYMQMGLPVVASRLLILEQHLDDDMIRFCEPGNVQEFTAAIKELWANPSLRQSLVDNADRGFVQNHCWLNERAKYFHLLDELLNTSLLAVSEEPAHSTLELPSAHATDNRCATVASDQTRTPRACP